MSTQMPSWAPLPLLGPALIVMLIYYWSKITPNVTMTFLLGIQFKSQWFPWVLVAFTVLTGGDPRMELMGIAAGHIYFFLNDMYPRVYGRTLISTPQFMCVHLDVCIDDIFFSVD
jgi:Derlin-2/3